MKQQWSRIAAMAGIKQGGARERKGFVWSEEKKDVPEELFNGAIKTWRKHKVVVNERLGHANISLTLDTYSHVLPSTQQAVSEKLENLVFAKVTHHRHTK